MHKLPIFEPTAKEQEWIDNERNTAKVIQLLWRHSAKVDRSDPEFLKILVRCSWVNGRQASDEARRVWRNQFLAEWLDLNARFKDDELAAALVEYLGMTPRDARWLVRTPSGFAGYYMPQRTIFFKQFEKHVRVISKAFTLISNARINVESNIGQVAGLIFDLPRIKAPNGGHASMMNGLSPALACLDPTRRFPVMNQLTKKLLAVLGNEMDVSGALELSRQIGHSGIKDSFYLDVYSWNRCEKLKPAKKGSRISVNDPRTVGIKAEENAFANLTKRKIVIRKRHNVLINKFRLAVKRKFTPEESEYDILIEGWKRGKRLLIEAKTETVGVLGRTQIRQAIGQLFDYRWRSFRDEMGKVDLALLTLAKPDKDILGLLADLRIEAFWFEGKTLKGTTALI